MNDNRRTTITVDDEPKDVPAAPLTLLFHQGAMRIGVPAAVEINPQSTVEMARCVSPAMWTALRDNKRFQAYYRMIWQNEAMPVVSSKANFAQLHTVGLILMCDRAAQEGKRVFLKLPETYLHPKQQAGLADYLIIMTKDEPV